MKDYMHVDRHRILFKLRTVSTYTDQVHVRSTTCSYDARYLCTYIALTYLNDLFNSNAVHCNATITSVYIYYNSTLYMQNAN
jgi:hypothetical protein